MSLTRPYDLNYDLDDARFFAEVVKAGGYTAASKAMRIPKSTLSRRLSRLEESLGVQLLRRTTRNFALTGEGEAFYQGIIRGIEVMQEAGSQLRRGSQSESTALIRMTAPVNFANAQIAEAISAFRRTHPDTRIELLMTDRVLDLVTDRIDIALRAGAPVIEGRSESVIARRISWVEFILVASPDYLKKRKSPKNAEAFRDMDCISFEPSDEGPMPWELQQGSRRLLVDGRVRYQSDSLPMILELAVSGCGVAFLPESICRKEIHDGRLIQLLPEWRGERTSAYLVYPKDRFQPARIRALLEELQKALKG